MSSSDFLLIVGVYFIGLIFQLIAWPLLSRVFRDSVDRGWGFGRLIGWLFISLVSWELGFLGVNIRYSIFVTSLLLLGVGGVVLMRKKGELWSEFMKVWSLVLTEEVLFAVGLFGMCWIRSFNPNILDLEKFMDAGFMASYLRSQTLPAMDMWLAGESINYYTFGHYMGSVMTLIWSIDLAYSYNLLLGWLMGLILTGSFSLVINLSGDATTQKRRPLIIGGLIGSLLVGIGGNSQTVWYFLKNGSFEKYWYADATRFIENTIHEFPSYSFVVSDLHAHLWDLPIVLFYMLVLIMWSRAVLKDGSEWWSSVMGGLVGVMAMTNTWDVLIYGMLTGLVGLMCLVKGAKWEKLLSAATKFGVSFVLVAILWMKSFVSISEGVRMVTKRSPAWQLLALWGGHILITGAASVIGFIQVMKKKEKGTGGLFIAAMGIMAAILLIIPELIYFKDIYPNHPRANTMFKFTYQSFVLMSLLGGWTVCWLKSRKISLVGNALLFIPMMVVFGSLMLFPYFGYRDYYGGFKTQKGLDGFKWLEERSPDDYRAIQWLKGYVKGRPVILEAVGESYTTFGRVSTITGLPTVLGWRVHEWLWRGGFEIPGARTGEVKMIYEQPGSIQSREILEKYNVEYIFIGDQEMEAYQMKVEELEKLGEVVFSSGATRIVRVKR